MELKHAKAIESRLTTGLLAPTHLIRDPLEIILKLAQQHLALHQALHRLAIRDPYTLSPYTNTL